MSERSLFQLNAHAEAAYKRYAVYTGGKNHLGLPMPEFQELPAKIRGAWIAAITPLLPTTTFE